MISLLLQKKCQLLEKCRFKRRKGDNKYEDVPETFDTLKATNVWNQRRNEKVFLKGAVLCLIG